MAKVSIVSGYPTALRIDDSNVIDGVGSVGGAGVASDHPYHSRQTVTTDGIDEAAFDAWAKKMAHSPLIADSIVRKVAPAA